ncbi:MAG: hypothetical protein ACK5JC_07300 [Bacteroidota bacterium]|jgi:hypothetical protein
MAIYYLQSHEIDYAKWDAAVKNSLRPLIYANSWYLDVVNPGWCGIVKNDYEWIFPVPAKQKIFIPYCYTPAFVQQLGFFGKHIPGIEEVEEVLNKLANKFVRVNLNVQHLTSYPERMVKILPNSLLNLFANYEALSAAYSENLKRNLKKAARFELTLDDKVHPDELIHLFSAMQNKASKTFMKQTESLFPSLCETVKKHAELICVGLRHEGYICCGIVLFCFEGRITLIFSANSLQGKEMFGMYYLLDQLFRRLAQTANFFDFEGSTDPGTSRLYHSFGAMRENYLQIKLR